MATNAFTIAAMNSGDWSPQPAQISARTIALGQQQVSPSNTGPQTPSTGVSHDAMRDRLSAADIRLLTGVARKAGYPASTIKAINNGSAFLIAELQLPAVADRIIPLAYQHATFTSVHLLLGRLGYSRGTVDQFMQGQAKIVTKSRRAIDAATPTTSVSTSTSVIGSGSNSNSHDISVGNLAPLPAYLPIDPVLLAASDMQQPVLDTPASPASPLSSPPMPPTYMPTRAQRQSAPSPVEPTAAAVAAAAADDDQQRRVAAPSSRVLRPRTPFSYADPASPTDTSGDSIDEAPVTPPPPPTRHVRIKEEAVDDNADADVDHQISPLVLGQVHPAAARLNGSASLNRPAKRPRLYRTTLGTPPTPLVFGRNRRVYGE